MDEKEKEEDDVAEYEELQKPQPEDGPYDASAAYKKLPFVRQALVRQTLGMPEGNARDKAFQHWGQCADKEMGQAMLAALLEVASAMQAKARPNILAAEGAGSSGLSIKELRAERNGAEAAAHKSKKAAEGASIAELEVQARVAQQIASAEKATLDSQTAAEKDAQALTLAEQKLLAAVAKQEREVGGAALAADGKEAKEVPPEQLQVEQPNHIRQPRPHPRRCCDPRQEKQDGNLVDPSSPLHTATYQEW